VGQPPTCDAGLLVIDLSRNRVGDETAAALATFLPQDLWLWALRLFNCGITTKGASALLDSLLSNETLVALDIRGNSCDGSLPNLPRLALALPMLSHVARSCEPLAAETGCFVVWLQVPSL
jgi:Ran GTPase-activating protein (RanGAP) involved in mRNA processing and transport